MDTLEHIRLDKLPENPVTLAVIRAEERSLQGSDSVEIMDADDWTVKELEHAAVQLGFIGRKYFIESHRSLSIPVAWDDGNNVSYLDYRDLTFEGNFTTYSKVHVGRIIGGTSVRALCVTFHDVTLLSYLDRLPDDHLLHVPVLAVESIDPQVA